MRTLTTALAAAALAVLPMHAAASTPNSATEQTKPEPDTQSDAAQAAYIPTTESARESTKKPTEQQAVQTGASVEPRPDQSAQSDANEREASPAES